MQALIFDSPLTGIVVDSADSSDPKLCAVIVDAQELSAFIVPE